MEQIRISFTKIIDYINSTGVDKIKCVKEAIEVEQEKYSPVKDHYKEVREHIIKHFKHPEIPLSIPKKWSFQESKQKDFIVLFENIKETFW